MTPTQADLDAFNDGVRRARAEYQLRPNRACLVEDCTYLATDGHTVCLWHRTLGRGRVA